MVISVGVILLETTSTVHTFPHVATEGFVSVRPCLCLSWMSAVPRAQGRHSRAREPAHLSFGCRQWAEVMSCSRLWEAFPTEIQLPCAKSQTTRTPSTPPPCGSTQTRPAINVDWFQPWQAFPQVAQLGKYFFWVASFFPPSWTKLGPHCVSTG